MYLLDSLSRQPFLDNFWLFLTKFSQLLDGFLAFPKMIRLIVYTLELRRLSFLRFSFSRLSLPADLL